MLNFVERFEDMSPRGRLRLLRQDDGDVIVQIIPDPNEKEKYAPTAEFCLPGSGGGDSARTRDALIKLMHAMYLDNEEKPQHREDKNE